MPRSSPTPRRWRPSRTGEWPSTPRHLCRPAGRGRPSARGSRIGHGRRRVSRVVAGRHASSVRPTDRLAGYFAERRRTRDRPGRPGRRGGRPDRHRARLLRRPPRLRRPPVRGLRTCYSPSRSTRYWATTATVGPRSRCGAGNRGDARAGREPTGHLADADAAGAVPGFTAPPNMRQGSGIPVALQAQHRATPTPGHGDQNVRAEHLAIARIRGIPSTAHRPITFTIRADCRVTDVPVCHDHVRARLITLSVQMAVGGQK